MRVTFDELRESVAQFVAERDWAQFHTPKNMAICLSVEASELLELYMWTRDPRPDGEKGPPGTEAPRIERVKEELGDVMLSLLNFCAAAGLDPIAAAAEKLERTKAKYPVSLCKGKALKSTALKNEN